MVVGSSSSTYRIRPFRKCLHTSLVSRVEWWLESKRTERWPVTLLAVSGVDVGAQGTPDDVAQVGDIVDIGEGRGDQDVLPPRDGENGIWVRGHGGDLISGRAKS